MTETWPGRDAIAKRAQRQWLVRMIVLAVVLGVGLPTLDPVIDPAPSSASRHHPHRPVEILVILAWFLIVVGVTAWLSRKRWRASGNLSAPITLGLPRRQRRDVLRAIRRGAPSSDPTLAAIGRETAERIVRQTAASFALLGIFLALAIVEDATTSRTGTRVFFAVTALVLAGLLLMQLWYARGARRYLAADRDQPVRS